MKTSPILYNTNYYGICEIFPTIQCEGINQGIPSIIIRLYGCNLNCKRCDSIMDSYSLMNKEEVLTVVRKFNCKHIIITGGEPTIYKNINLLVVLFKNNGYYVTVETNATIKRKLNCDLVSLSPKISSVMKTDYNSINIDVINYYLQNNNYQIKFVSRNKESDFKRIINIISNFSLYNPDRIMVMALSNSKNELDKIQKDIISLCIKYNLRYANRLQLQVWNNEREYDNEY